MEKANQPQVTAGRRLSWANICLIVTVIVLISLIALGGTSGILGMPAYFFFTQDLTVVILSILLIALLGRGLIPQVPAFQFGKRPVVWAALLVPALIATAGTEVVMGRFPLSRDEQMVVFDSVIFRTGHAVAFVPETWRAFANALAPMFRLELAGDAAWISAYLPGNAAFRAMFSLAADPALLNPALLVMGGVALFSIARRAFPGDPAAQAVALLFYATSTQAIAAAMTPYAMTGHLALNLAWLALFLRGGILGHGAAAAVAFLATGLHQIAFHPLFAAPFLLHLLQKRRFVLLATYAAVYAAIGLFWINYQHWLAEAYGLTVPSGVLAGGIGFIAERIVPLLKFRADAVDLTALNLLRFAAWQNLMLLPFLVAAAPVAWRNKGIALPLVGGLVLTTVVAALILPYQGHGWGYRYLHGLIGNAALVGAYGFVELRWRGAKPEQLLVAGTALTVVVAAPWLLWRAHALVSPFADADRRIGGIAAEFAVIDTDKTGFAIDQVRNDPFLRNRPLRFASTELSPEQAAVLCRRGRVAFVDRAWLGAAVAGSNQAADREFTRLELGFSPDCHNSLITLQDKR